MGLWPREHGAYVQLAAPLATALVLQQPTLASGAVAVAACSAFLANEPLLVMLGHRGKRRLEASGAQARQRLVVLCLVALVAFAAALWLAPSLVRAAAFVAGPAAVTLVLAWQRKERTLAGEMVAAAALSGGGTLAFVAGDGSLDAALVLWGAWSAGFAATAIAVHRVIARHKARATWHDAAALIVLAGAAIGSGVWIGRQPLIIPLTVLAAASALLVAWPPRATRLRTIGVVLAIVSVLAGAAVVTASI